MHRIIITIAATLTAGILLAQIQLTPMATPPPPPPARRTIIRFEIPANVTSNLLAQLATQCGTNADTFAANPVVAGNFQINPQTGVANGFVTLAH
jgi:hypothetical protein